MSNELSFYFWIDGLDLVHQLGHHPVDAALGLVQRLDEEVPDVGHEAGEAEEAVGLRVL